MTSNSTRNVDIKGSSRSDRRVLALATATFATGTEAHVYVGQLESLAIDLDASLADVGTLSGIVVLAFLGSAVALAAYSLLPFSGLDAASTRYVLMGMMVAGAAALFARTPLIQAGLVRIDPDRASVLLALNGSMVFAGRGLGAAVAARWRSP